MGSINISEVDIANLSGCQDSTYPLNSINRSSMTLTQINNTNNTNPNPNGYDLNKIQDNVNIDSNFFKEHASQIIKPTNTCKNLLYCIIACSVISYVLFIISLSLPKWQQEYSFFQLKKNIFSVGIDTVYMIVIMIFTIVDFIFLLVLLRLNRFYKKTYYVILISFGILVLLKTIFESVYLIRVNFDLLGSSFWLFTSSIVLDLISLLLYIGLIKVFENEIKSLCLSKQLEDFKKYGFDSGIVDSLTLVGSTGSQSQIQLASNVNRSIPEKNILNYQNQHISISSLSNQPLFNNGMVDSINTNPECIAMKNIQNNHTTAPYSANSVHSNINSNSSHNGFPSLNSNPKRLSNISNLPTPNSNTNSNSNNNILKISPVENSKNTNIVKDSPVKSKNNTNENITNKNISNKNITNENITNENIANENITNENITNENITNENITNENCDTKTNDQPSFNSNINSSSKLDETSSNNNSNNSINNNLNNNLNNCKNDIESGINNFMNNGPTSSENVSKNNIKSIHDNSLIKNLSSSDNPSQNPEKSTIENKNINNNNSIIESQNINVNHCQNQSQIIDHPKNNKSGSNTDKNNSLILSNTMEPIYSYEVESSQNIESLAEYSSMNKVKQNNNIPTTTNSLSTYSKPKSQISLQQYSKLQKLSNQSRPQSYQFGNHFYDKNSFLPYTASLNSKKSPTTIDDYIPLQHYSNSPSSSQMAMKSQRDSLLNQIFGTNNDNHNVDNHSYISMNALADNGRKETYQSFDQLTPLEDYHHQPLMDEPAENASITKLPRDIPNDISNDIVNEMQSGSLSQTLYHSNIDSYDHSHSFHRSNSNSNSNTNTNTNSNTNSNSHMNDSLFETLSYSKGNMNSDQEYSTQILIDKDLTDDSPSLHGSSIYNKNKIKSINQYSVKSLQLKTNVPLSNHLDPVLNERINSITVNKYAKEEKVDLSKETNFDILASSSSIASNYNSKEKEYSTKEPYYINNSSSYYEKMPYYEKVEEYKGGSEGKDSIVSSLSITSSSSSSLNTSDSSLKAHYKKYGIDRKRMNSPPKINKKVSSHPSKSNRSQQQEDCDLNEHLAEERFIADYYETKEHLEHDKLNNNNNNNNHHLSKAYSYSNQPLTPSSSFEQNQKDYEQKSHRKDQIDRTSSHIYSQQNEKRNNHRYSIPEVFNNEMDRLNILDSDDDDDERLQDKIKRYYDENQYDHDFRHHHAPPSIISSISSCNTSSLHSSNSSLSPNSYMRNIDYERELDDYDNQKPPVTVVTIPPLSPFELPAIAIPFNQPDPREVISPIITTQATLTTKPTSYTLNNHLSISYDHSRNFLNDFTTPSSYHESFINNINSNGSNSNNNNSINDNNHNYNKININNINFNERVLANKIRPNTKLVADEFFSPNHYPRHSQPYPSSHSQSSSHHNSITQQYSSSSSKPNDNPSWPSSEMSYTSQLIQQRQKNNMAKRSIRSMTSNNSSIHQKNKSFVDI